MNKSIVTLIAAPLLWACGASYPVPTQPLADAEGAERSATEVGATTEPAAQLHLKLATEQINQAKLAMKEGDNQRANFLLVRAKADAELALALAREQNAKTDEQKTGKDAVTQSATTTILNGANK